MPASPKLCSMLWHYVEHIPCTPRARAERAFGTHVRRADTLAPTVLARSAAPRHALPFSPLRAKPPLATPAGQELAAAAARQPLPMSAPPKPLPLATWPLEQRVLIRECVH